MPRDVYAVLLLGVLSWVKVALLSMVVLITPNTEFFINRTVFNASCIRIPSQFQSQSDRYFQPRVTIRIKATVR